MCFCGANLADFDCLVAQVDLSPRDGLQFDSGWWRGHMGSFSALQVRSNSAFYLVLWLLLCRGSCRRIAGAVLVCLP